MLRCRDVCLRCAGGKRGVGLSLNGTRGIASRTTSLGGAQTGLRVHGQSPGPSPLAGPTISGLQRGTFSTTTARRISEKELGELREQISLEEQNIGSEKGDGRDGKRRLNMPPKPAMTSRALEMELRWLRDPKEMVNRVRSMLSKKQVDMALALVQAAHREGMDCVAAWNQILDYEMEQGRPDSAFKMYNDMKKRGQRPEARTYTIMFKGLATNDTSSKSVSRAQSIYESLCSPSSGFKPSSFHNNAVLNVYARHGDLGALWEAAGKLPEQGYGAPDARTYTIILNALKRTTEQDVKRMDRERQKEGIRLMKGSAIREAKRMWTDIVKKWREGQLIVDQPLINAMGQMLLLRGSPMDGEDVLSLIQQTMGIKVVGIQRGEIRRRRAEQFQSTTIKSVAEQQNEVYRDVVKEPGASRGNVAPEAVENLELTEEEEFRGLFEHVQLDQIRRKAELNVGVKRLPEFQYPKPTNSELTLVIAACATIDQGVRSGRMYWKNLTSETGPYKIVPDQPAYSQYLRLLRLARASDEALETLRTMASRFRTIGNKNYLIAMSTCLRDRKNPNVLNIANEILDLWDFVQEEVDLDPGVLDRYIGLTRLYTSPTPQPETYNLNPDVQLDGFDDVDNTKRKSKTQLAILDKALNKLQPHISKLKSAVEQGHLDYYPKPDTGDVLLDRKRREEREMNEKLMKILPAVRELYNRVLHTDFRRVISRNKTLAYRSECASLDELLRVERSRFSRAKVWSRLEVERAQHSGKDI